MLLRDEYESYSRGGTAQRGGGEENEAEDFSAGLRSLWVKYEKRMWRQLSLWGEMEDSFVPVHCPDNTFLIWHIRKENCLYDYV